MAGHYSKKTAFWLAQAVYYVLWSVLLYAFIIALLSHFDWQYVWARVLSTLELLGALGLLFFVAAMTFARILDRYAESETESR